MLPAGKFGTFLRLTPVGQLHAQAGSFAAKQPVAALNGLGQPEMLAGGTNRRCIAHLGFDFDDVAHIRSP